MGVNTQFIVSELPLELIITLADFLCTHIENDLMDYRYKYINYHLNEPEYEKFEKQILISCGVRNDDYYLLKKEALKTEKELGFFNSSTVLQYCIAKSPTTVGEKCLDYAIGCDTQFKNNQNKLLEVASRYGFQNKTNRFIKPLQVVYGADLLSRTSLPLSILLPGILIFDNILSDEGELFDEEHHAEYYARVPDDFKVLKREGILVPYSWGTLSLSVLFPNQSLIRDVELESEEIYLRSDKALQYPKHHAPLLASHGYATSLKLSIPSLTLPGDQIPHTLYSPVRPNALPNPELASTIWILEALGVILENFAVSKMPIEEILEIREKVRAREAHSEFRELALSEIGRLKGDLRGANITEIQEEIRFDIQTNFKPSVSRLMRDLAEIDSKRKRKFLTKIREEGLSLTLNLLGLIVGPDRNQALLELSKTLYSSAETGLADINIDIPKGLSFAVNISKEFKKRLG